MLDDFQTFFTVVFFVTFATKCMSYFPPYYEVVATQPYKTQKRT